MENCRMLVGWHWGNGLIPIKLPKNGDTETRTQDPSKDERSNHSYADIVYNKSRVNGIFALSWRWGLISGPMLAVMYFPA